MKLSSAFLASTLATVTSWVVLWTPGQGPQPASPSGSPTDPTFFQSQDIGHGFSLDAYFQATGALIEPTTSSTVKAVSILLDVRYGLASLELIHSLETRFAADATPLVFQVGGLDPSTAVPAQEPSEPFVYLITVQPKPGFTWFDAGSIENLLIEAVEQERTSALRRPALHGTRLALVGQGEQHARSGDRRGRRVHRSRRPRCAR